MFCTLHCGLINNLRVAMNTTKVHNSLFLPIRQTSLLTDLLKCPHVGSLELKFEEATHPEHVSCTDLRNLYQKINCAR